MSAQEHGGHLIVRSVADEGPAKSAGVRPGDVLLAVGGVQVDVAGRALPRHVGLGEPGVSVPLRLRRENRVLELAVPSIDRMRWLRLNQTY